MSVNVFILPAHQKSITNCNTQFCTFQSALRYPTLQRMELVASDLHGEFTSHPIVLLVFFFSSICRRSRSNLRSRDVI